MIPDRDSAQVNDPRPTNLKTFAVFGEICLATGTVVNDIPTSPTIGSGSGVPTHTRPDGSIFLRTDGIKQKVIYIRKNDAWWSAYGSLMTYFSDVFNNYEHDFLTEGPAGEHWNAGGDYLQFDEFRVHDGKLKVAVNNTTGGALTATLSTSGYAGIWYGLQFLPAWSIFATLGTVSGITEAGSYAYIQIGEEGVESRGGGFYGSGAGTEFHVWNQNIINGAWDDGTALYTPPQSLSDGDELIIQGGMGIAGGVYGGVSGHSASYSDFTYRGPAGKSDLEFAFKFNAENTEDMVFQVSDVLIGPLSVRM